MSETMRASRPVPIVAAFLGIAAVHLLVGRGTHPLHVVHVVFGRIERHPAIAADILRPIRGAEELAEIVMTHHESPDGSGYPRSPGSVPGILDNPVSALEQVVAAGDAPLGMER